MKIMIFISMFFGIGFGSLFVLDLQIKSIDKYINSLKYENALLFSDDENGNASSLTFGYDDSNDNDDVSSISKPNTTLLFNETNENRQILNEMHNDYIHNVTEFNLLMQSITNDSTNNE